MKIIFQEKWGIMKSFATLTDLCRKQPEALFFRSAAESLDGDSQTYLRVAYLPTNLTVLQSVDLLARKNRWNPLIGFVPPLPQIDADGAKRPSVLFVVHLQNIDGVRTLYALQPTEPELALSTI
jgi:hypothetical protein